MSSLHQLARTGDVEEGEKVLAALGDPKEVNGKDKLQRTALMLACWANKPAFVTLLLATPQVDVHAQAMDNADALSFAAGSGATECCALLLDAGAAIEAISGKVKRTALMLAARKGHVETVKLLLARGADPCAKDSAGATAADQTEATKQELRHLLEAAMDARRAKEDKEERKEEESVSNGKDPHQDKGDEGQSSDVASKKREAPSVPAAPAVVVASVAKKPKMALSFQDDLEEDESDLL